MVSFTATAVMWGTSFLFIKVAVRDIAPVYVAFGRIVLGALTLLVLLSAVGQRLPRHRRTWGHAFLIGLCLHSIPFTLFAYAEQRVSSATAGVWSAATPLSTTLAALLLLPSERPTRRLLAGLLLSFLGVAVVLGVWNGLGGASFTGQLMLTGAVACYGLGFSHTRWILNRQVVTPLGLGAAQLVMAALQMAVVAPLVAGPPPGYGTMPAGAIGAVAALGVFATGLAFLLSAQVAEHMGATAASTVTYLSPAIAAFTGVVLLGEHMQWNQPVGGLIILLGMLLGRGTGNSRRAPAPRYDAPADAPR
ncbi:DMT family transporter [Streptomyces sp. 2A115]|uniref:DMT family transporter n=1 Tax=Streptomyces sp. 2A115 TaxID=3457439 RepID=UPI003FD47793